MGPSFELTEDDRGRLGEIRAMKRTASLVLLGATVVFVVARILESRSSAWGYVRATAEAAMVGGIADWFAVTALFRHPLGIPIPHTAILPNRKDQLGRTFGSFVKSSFLAPEVLAERLSTISVSARLAEWLREPANAALAAEKAGSLAATAIRLLDDDEVSDLLTTDVLGRLRAVDVAPIAGQVLDIVTEDGRHHQLLDATLKAVADMLADQRPILRRRFELESPWWVPDAVDDRVFDKIYSGVNAFLREVRSNPDHEVRRHVDAKVADLAVRLSESPELAERANQIKDDLLSHPALREWAMELWSSVQDNIVAQSTDPASTLRTRLTVAAQALAHALTHDAALTARVDAAAVEIVSVLAERYGDEVAGFVETTVQRWDATETSTRVELLLGRDLQIIRINGSVVGGLAGLVIFTISRLFG
ncbi:MAG: DUF445 domain-containing protein [Acidimicrobiales bacterium]